MQDIFKLIKEDRKEDLKSILKGKIKILKLVNSDGITPLLFSLYSGKMELAQCIYSLSVDFTIHENIGMNDFIKVKEKILHDKVNVNTYSQDGWTPLHLAAFWGNKEITLLLLENRAILDLPSKSKVSLGNSALQAAIAMQQIEMVELLLEKGANPNFVQEPSLYTPLHIASAGKNEKIVTLLFDKGADKTKKSADGKFPLDIAKERLMEKNVTLLEI